MLNEFKEFAMRGNALDLTVGVTVGAAFGKIVDSVVHDLIGPLVGRVIGNVDLGILPLPLSANIGGETPEPVVAYGNFLTTVFEFLVLAFVSFLFVRAMNRLMRIKANSPAIPPAPTKEEVLLTEIRDILRANQTATR